MGRLIDADILIAELKESALHHCNNSREDSLLQRDRVIVRAQPTVEAIPKAEVKKFLEEGTKNISNNVLAIVREDYIHKAEYETRLKADMAAMLEDLRLDFQEAELAGVLDNKELIFADEVDDLVQQKINALKAESEN